MSEAATDPPSRAPPPSPYRGLRPYEEADAAFFVGRETEVENVEANLLSIRLTLLYGPSGVGKSSVLFAGVAGSLRERAREDVEGGAAALFAVVVARSWSEADPLKTIAAEARRAVTELLGDSTLPDPPAGATLAEVLDHWSVQVHGKLLVLFDQFEEYFLYHGSESGPGTFDHEFPQAVNRPDLRANFLLSIRNDALSQLDRFKGRMPSLFDNRLQIDHLTVAAARDAIEKPLDEYNLLVTPEQRVEIEDELVRDVLDQVRTDRVPRGSAGAGALREGAAGESRVETPILQVVLTALWEREEQLGSHTLRAQTLRDLGGATQLVADRLDERMSTLSASEQDVAADVARYLVTPSKTKIALAAADLAQLAYEDPDLADAARPAIESVLNKLAEGDTRILRPVEPLGGEGSTRYELFHDVLAEPILEWRREFAQERTRRRARRQFAVVGVVVLAVLSVFAGLTVWALKKSSDATNATVSARSVALASASLTQPQLGTKLLLSLEAERTRDTAEASGSMIDALYASGRLGDPEILHLGQGADYAVAYSPDGRTLAAPGADGKIVLWDAAHGYTKLRALDIGQSAVLGVAFSPDGRTLAAASANGEVVLWERAQHGYTRLTRLESGRSAVWWVAFSSDGRVLAAAYNDGRVVLWKRTAHGYTKLKALGSGQSALLGVVFSPDGRTLAAAGGDGEVVLWKRTARGYTGRTALESGQSDGVNGVAFSPDGSTLAAAGGDGKVVLWKRTARGYTGRTALESGQSDVNGVAFSPDGSTLAAAGFGGVVLWERKGRSYTERSALDSSQSDANLVAFSPDGRVLAAAYNDGEVALWARAAGGYTAKPGAVSSGQSSVAGVAFSPNGGTLAAAGGDGEVVLWKRTARGYTGRTVLESGQSSFAGVAFSPDGSTLAAAGGDSGEVVLWKRTARGYIPRMVLESGQSSLAGVAFSPSGGTLAGAGEDNEVVLWKRTAHGYTKLIALDTQSNGVAGVAFSPHGRTLAAAGYDGEVVLWKRTAHGYTERTALESGQSSLTGVAFSPDGGTLAAAGYDGEVMLWKRTAHGYTERTALESGESGVNGVAFSPDGSTLAAAGYDNEVVLWDAAHGYTKLIALDTQSNGVAGVAFSPHGRTLAAAGYDGTVVLGDFFWRDFADLKARVCGLVHGNLTETEWEAIVPGLSYSTTCPY